MKHLPSSLRHTRSKLALGARLSTIAALTLSTSVLAACSGVSDLTKERVANSAVAVQQTEQSLGRSEDGMVELQQAKENLAAAQEAMARTDEKSAQRFASKAQLHADLAIAQSQSAAARRAAEEVLASTNALRKEAERTNPSPVTP